MNNNNVADDEITTLYRKCGIDTNINIAPRATINTGILSSYISYNLHFMLQTSASADRLRWE